MTTLKNKHGHHHQSDYDLQGDVEKIKAALMEASQNFKGRAGELFTDSLDDIKERTTTAKDNFADYTADRPFKTLGIAFLAGLAIGYLIHK